jgi:hypothetical protein
MVRVNVNGKMEKPMRVTGKKINKTEKELQNKAMEKYLEELLRNL